MLYANKNLRELENKVNIERGNLCDWLKANKPSLNIKNSNFVIFQSRQNPYHSFLALVFLIVK